MPPVAARVVFRTTIVNRNSLISTTTELAVRGILRYKQCRNSRGASAPRAARTIDVQETAICGNSVVHVVECISRDRFNWHRQRSWRHARGQLPGQGECHPVRWITCGDRAGHCESAPE